MKKIILSFVAVLFFTVTAFAAVTVTPYGAAGGVSGSCFLYEAAGKKILIDCGMFMGSESGQNLNLPQEVIDADVLILTHAHLDHSGRVPLLISKGFKGKIYSTPATKDIALNLFAGGEGMDLIDRQWFWSASQMEKAKEFGSAVVIHWNENCGQDIKNTERSDGVMSLDAVSKQEGVRFMLCRNCAKAEAEEISKRFVTVNYSSMTTLFKGIKFEFVNSAHIPGSASILISAENKKVLFSGDLGSGHSRLTGMFDTPPAADDVFMEATYADDKADFTEKDYDAFRNDLSKAVSEHKIIWIPALALNRTQKILYELNLMQKNGTLSKDVPIYSISPSANSVTMLYEKESSGASKTDGWFAKEVYDNGIMPQNARLQPSRGYEKQMILISASGDMDMGMSEKLVEKLAPNKNVFIMIVNYVSPDSNAGRFLKGEPAKNGTVLAGGIKKYEVFSDHPGFAMIKRWLSAQNKDVKIYLIHSEEATAARMMKLLNDEGMQNIFQTSYGEKITL